MSTYDGHIDAFKISDSESELDPTMITSSSLSNAVLDSKYREVCGVRSGRNLVFLLLCDDFPLVLRFEGGGMEVRFGSGMKS